MRRRLAELEPRDRAVAAARRGDRRRRAAARDHADRPGLARGARRGSWSTRSRPPASSTVREKLDIAHPLIAVAIIEALAPAVLERLHRESARALIALGASTGDVARHLLHSRPHGDPEVSASLPDASHTAPKAMWLKDEEPANFHAARWLVSTVGHLNGWLTGEVVQDHADASSTLLYNLASRGWCGELVGLAGLDESRLPAIRPAREVIGSLRADVAEQLGTVDPLPGGRRHRRRPRRGARRGRARHRGRRDRHGRTGRGPVTGAGARRAPAGRDPRSRRRRHAPGREPRVRLGREHELVGPGPGASRRRRCSPRPRSRRRAATARCSCRRCPGRRRRAGTTGCGGASPGSDSTTTSPSLARDFADLTEAAERMVQVAPEPRAPAGADAGVLRGRLSVLSPVVRRGRAGPGVSAGKIGGHHAVTASARIGG